MPSDLRNDSPDTLPRPTMERRGFLQAVGAAAGIATLLGPDALRGVKAAVNSVADLTPVQAAREESLWNEVQQAFTMSRSLINMDNGFTCPTPRVVTEAVKRTIDAQEEMPYGQWTQEARPRIATVREGLANLFGCSPDEIAITRNATEALRTVIYGFSLKPGDEILTSSQDYDSMLATLDHRAQRDGVTVVKAPVPTPPKTMDELVGIFERAITSKTRLILVSHITYTTGQIFPIKRICDLAHSHGIDVLVDGAHSFAHLDFKVADLGCDYFGTSLHKWLLAPKGTGMLYIRKDKIASIPPMMGPPPRNGADRMRKYESVGIQSTAPNLAIGEALGFHNAIGSKLKEERLRYLKNTWAERLQALPRVRLYTPLAAEMSCGLAAIGIEGVEPTGLRNYLWEKHSIQTSRGYYEQGGTLQWIRVSANLYTTMNEMDNFCSVLEEVAKSGIPEPYKSFKPDPRLVR